MIISSDAGKNLMKPYQKPTHFHDNNTEQIENRGQLLQPAKGFL